MSCTQRTRQGKERPPAGMKINVSIALNGLACWLLCLIFLLAVKPVYAHPMGNFSINHYTRLTLQGDMIVGLYVLDMAEIPTVSEMNLLDADHDGKISDAENKEYLKRQCSQLQQNLALAINGVAVPLLVLPGSLSLRPGAGGLQTLRLTLKMSASLPPSSGAASFASGVNSYYRVYYKDTNFPLRTGWKEIVVTGPTGLLRDSSVPSIDVSKELTLYPADPSLPPPQVTEAHFTISRERQTARSANQRPIKSDPRSTRGPDLSQNSTFGIQNSNTPQDKFTQSIAAQGLTPAVILLSLVSAFLFGAMHALSPGHGKAMVAAYLVGTRGTSWHAVLLGLVVTLTHTMGVFALGVVTLSASKYIVAERLYPVLSGLSGLAVVCMGGFLFWNRLAAWRATAQFSGEAGEADASEKSISADSLKTQPDSRTGSDEFLYQRRNANSVSLRTLIGLGITGGALPCPSALVVMLSAIALHRIAFGLFLIVAFSMGLAVVLTILGLLMMRARGMLERLPSQAHWMQGLSVASAGGVTVVGLVLLVRALYGAF